MSNSSQDLEAHTEDHAPATEESSVPNSGPATPRPTKTVECNMMSYADDDGVTRQIYMPKGTAGLADALLTAKRFSDLDKFPAWGD